MFVFRAMKELKKKLKKRRRPVWSLGMLAAVFLAASSAGIGTAVLIQKAVFSGKDAMPAAFSVSETGLPPEAAMPPSVRTSGAGGSRQAVIETLARWNGDVELVLRRVYWCGEEKRMLGRRPAPEAANLLKSHREWEAAFDSSGRLVMEETSRELSPSCRMSAYIGLDQGGNLSLFDGPPRKDNVVRTFFQLDVRSLESSMSKERLHELARGIRVADKDEFDSVLSVFSDYASRRSAGVMKPAP